MIDWAQDLKNEEISYHDKLYSSHKEYRKKESRLYRGHHQNILFDYALSQLHHLEGKNILCYGAGTDAYFLKTIVSMGGNVTAIDISKEAIKLLNSRIKLDDLENSAQAIEMDCEVLNFKNASFDFIFGSAIIHHLDTERAVAEIHRVLKSGGRAVFIEPLGYNPLLNLYRMFTAAARTRNEHPLCSRDFKIIKDKLTVLLFGLDNLLFKIMPPLSNYAWCTVITMVK